MHGMPGTALLAAIPSDPPPPRRRVTTAPAGSIFLPKEHGSWSLALEPIALGLLVAPSPAGVALATAALAGFFARRPLKIALAPDSTARRRLARETLAMLSALAVAGMLEAAVLGGVTALWPLLLAAPLGGLFVWFDSQNGSREFMAELAGSSAFALLPAAFATLAGWPVSASLALTAIALARNPTTVLTVRTYLHLGRRQPAGALVPILSGGLATLVLAGLAARRLVPWLAAGCSFLLLVRTILLVTSLRPDWPAKRVGLIEAALGALYVGTIALAYQLS